MTETTLTRINLTPTRHHRIKSDYGTFDYFRHYKRSHPESELTESQYRKILREVNTRIKDKIGNLPYDFKMPKRVGTIKVRKYYPEFRVDEDGTITNKLSIDFKATLDWWSKDREARDNKLKLYFENEHSDGFIFKIRYDKKTARFKNKSVYMFRPNRALKNILSKNIINKKIDAFL